MIKDYTYKILAVVLLILWLGFFADSSAEDFVRRPNGIDKSVEIMNAAPLIESLTLSDHEQSLKISTFVPTENANGFIYIYGTVNDGNGCEDLLNIDRWALTLYRSSTTDADSCISDPRSCYHAKSDSMLTLSNCNGISDTYINYQWRVPLAHNIDATDKGMYEKDDWRVNMSVSDVEGGRADSVESFEVATLRAITVNALVDYGSLESGMESQEKNILITNSGNESVDIEVRVDGDMICEVGRIASSNTHLSLAKGFEYSSPDLKLSTKEQWLDISLPKKGGIEASQREVYLKTKAPLSVVKGKCKNKITVTAIGDR